MPRKSPSKSAKAQEAARLKKLRKQLGMSVRELAKEFMVSHGSITLWELGERTIPGSVLKLMELYEDKLGAKSK